MLAALIIASLTVAAAHSDAAPTPDRQFGPWTLHEQQMEPKPSIAPQSQGIETLTLRLKTSDGTITLTADSLSITAVVHIQSGRTAYIGTGTFPDFPPQGQENLIFEKFEQEVQSTPTNLLPQKDRDAIEAELSAARESLTKAVSAMRTDSAQLIGGIHPISCLPPKCVF